ncbi:thiamine-phosphate pyrophosphorylase [Onishia taeanensis]|uniref:Thiamine-phosphate synthase n=1 Tax=Onishia taeanensis TaxID=284577 RepID=A0A328XJJ6_9GAMM|nr:thiamine phosphate synthase [Halomonas taeanensis]RAR57388.1 thiamine-phosphate pyrophosphorylase [Halomonas taeanensis]
MCNHSPSKAFDLSLYLVTDAALCAKAGLIDTVLAAVRGGVTMVQLRNKTASDAELIVQARRLMAALHGTGVPLIINDRLDVAIAAGADGLHIGQGDGDVAEARRQLGPDAILGLSVENSIQLAALDPQGLDYLGIGPVFATASKQDHAPPLGLEGLTELAASSPLPTVAIGGLNASHVEAIRQSGANGLAVISAICGQPDPQAAATAFGHPLS